MRALSSLMLAEIAKTITDPIYLFQVDLGSTVIYASSREEIFYDSNTYLTKGASLKSIDNRSVSFSIPNFDRSVSAAAFAGQIQNNDCTVYLYYSGEALGRFVGKLDAPSCSGDYNFVDFAAVDAYGMNSKWPYKRMQPPTFNHLPAPGTVIKLGNTNITLLRDEN